MSLSDTKNDTTQGGKRWPRYRSESGLSADVEHKGGRRNNLLKRSIAQPVHCASLSREERRPSAQIVERFATIFSIPQEEQTAFLRFARGDWKSALDEMPEEFPWSTSTKSPRSNLPTPVTSLIGREEDIAAVREYLLNPAIRLVTLMGPPGIGKTRLSIERGAHRPI